MEHEPVDPDTLDRTAYEAADEHFRSVRRHLPPERIESVAREVVRRLAFRMPKVRHPQAPSDSEIEELCTALLSPDESAGDRFILAARRDGATTEVIYLSYVAGAARRLGKLWEEDRISFVEVTVASGRLYRIIRGLRHVIDRNWGDDLGRPALFALVPDETHTLGIEMATDMFRREGWDVDLAVGEDHEAIVARAEETRYSAIVLVAHSQRMLDGLIRLVLALRITQPMAHVVVAGNLVAQVDDVAALVGADDVMADIEGAVATLRAQISGVG